MTKKESILKSIANLEKLELREYIDMYVNIGFCQPKFYTRFDWAKADTLMRYGIELDAVYAKNFGRGRGKYATDMTIKQVKEIIYNNLVNKLK